MSPRAPLPRLAVVTGASRGLGRTLAGFLGAQGFDLIVTARGRAALDRAAESFAGAGAMVEALAGDVSDPDHRARLAARVRARGSLDLLINNASELGPTPLPSADRLAASDLRRVLEVNLVAPLALTQALLPALESGHGRVVNISSDAAVGAYPGWAAYGASKAALDLLSRTLGEELKDRGVAVISVDPGDMRTEMHQAAFPGQDISDRPLPEATLPFWAWLLNQEGSELTGRRYRAQADRWEVAT